MKKIVSLFLASAFITVVPHVSLAWGKKGHDIIGEIAFSLTDSNTRLAVHKYLDTMTFEQASTWMDEVRKDPKYDYMKTWHYVNVEKGNDYKETKEGNIINALNKAIGELEHKGNMSDLDIKTDILIILHLVEDLHMPLHAGYGADKGGNTVHVNYLGHDANLHWVWDNEIIVTENITAADCLARLSALSKKEIADDKKINVLEWMKESRALLPHVYDFKDNTIDQEYADKNKTIIEDQLLIAGVRLSAVLEKLFGS